VLLVAGSVAGAVVLGVLGIWLGLALFAAAAFTAALQLVRIRVRTRASGGGKRRW
jgi:hypothetical protein